MLNKIKITDGVEDIRNEAFDGCGNLQTVEIPETVISIDPDAFINCRHIRLLVRPGSMAMEFARKERIPYITD